MRGPGRPSRRFPRRLPSLRAHGLRSPSRHPGPETHPQVEVRAASRGGAGQRLAARRSIDRKDCTNKKSNEGRHGTNKLKESSYIATSTEYLGSFLLELRKIILRGDLDGSVICTFHTKRSETKRAEKRIGPIHETDQRTKQSGQGEGRKARRVGCLHPSLI